MDHLFERKENETETDFLWRLGKMKEEGFCTLTWPELTMILNKNANQQEEHTESYWRKRYRMMALEKNAKEAQSAPIPSPLYHVLARTEKQRIRTRDQRNAYTRYLREEARREDLLEQLMEIIPRMEPVAPYLDRPITETVAVYAMLSDIHYGIAFQSQTNSYSPEIAKERVMRYAQEIIRIGEEAKAADCYVSLMGDMISGVIHETIRLENRENLIRQITGVSELIAAFLMELGRHFRNVYVNSVDGNHSRIDPNLDNVLRGEKLDALIPWYCRARLEESEHIHFVDNTIDPTIASFAIMGKTYVAVHGDMDGDMKTSALQIGKMMNGRVDYFLAAHMHIADMRMEDVGYIRNGCVCGSGDEYTAKKRLIGPAMQLAMIVTENGVRALFPVRL